MNMKIIKTKVTMKEIAREAGVSLGTVSNVLNKIPTVSVENRIKVMQVVERLIKIHTQYSSKNIKNKKNKKYRPGYSRHYKPVLS